MRHWRDIGAEQHRPGPPPINPSNYPCDPLPTPSNMPSNSPSNMPCDPSNYLATHSPRPPSHSEASRAPTETILPAFSSGATLRSATAAKRYRLE